MNISKPFIKLPVMTTLIMVALLFFGLSAYFKLPTSALPNISYPTLSVTATFPGASAEKVANLVTGPLERQFMSNATDVTIMTSMSTYQSSSIIIQFDLKKDIIEAMNQVQQGINEAQNILPNLPQLPTYTNVNPAQTPILYVVMTSPQATPGDLYEWAYTFLGQRVALLDGVGQVNTFGHSHAVRLMLDPQALASRNIGLNEVSSYIKSANPDIPTGNLFGNEIAYSIRSDEQLFTAEPYEDLIIYYQNNQPVRVKDVGYAENSTDNNKQFFNFIQNGQVNPACILAIMRQNRANTILTSDRVKNLINEYKTQLPGNVEVAIPYDQSQWIIESIQEVQMTLLLSLILVVTVIYLSLGRIRNTLIPALTLPITIVGTWAFMLLFGFSLDILSLLALTLSIGFLIDDAIIVLENIVRHVQQGKKPFQGALDGSKQISFTVLSTSISLCAVFIPMLFMGGLIGKLFFEFAATIIIAIVISSFISLTLTPMLASRFVPPYGIEEKVPWMEQKSEQMNAFLIEKYRKWLAWATKKRLFMIFIGAGCIVLNVLIYFQLPTTFLPQEDIGVVQVFLQSAESTSPHAMLQYQNQLDEILLKDPNILSTVTINSYPTNNQGMLFINLKPINERPPIEELIQQYAVTLNRIPGLSAYPKIYPFINLQVGSSQSGKGLYQYTLQSFDSDALYPVAEELFNALDQNRMFTDVSSDLLLKQPQLRVKILRDQARSYQLTAEDIQNALSLAYGETYITQLNTSQNQYYVVMQVEDRFYTNPSDFALLYVKSSITGDLVPLDSVVNVEKTSGPLAVNHINGLPSVTISFNLPPKAALGSALKELDQIASKIVPPGVIGKVEGTADIFKQSFSTMKFLFVIAIVVIYLLLGILYENFLHPLTVLSTLPPAVLGGFVTLFVFREPLSLYGFVGVIMLLGIVLKNGIMMVDFANEFRKKNPQEDPEKAIHEAALLRFRPILMTTLSTIFGALPIAVGFGGAMAAGRTPLGLTIIGGLCFSQVMTLFITPCVYIYLEEFSDWTQRKFKIFRSNPDEENSPPHEA
jgi:HAE1 family hydrophobic/amphiphilic exporter-1